MRNIILLIVCSILLSSSAYAQNTWQGDTPGKATDWDCPGNWSLHRVPDTADDVIIPNLYAKGQAYPAIKSHAAAQSLKIMDGAGIVIHEGGSLYIDGEGTYQYGILNAGTVCNNGGITIVNTAMAPLLTVGSGRTTGKGEWNINSLSATATTK